jgi:phage/plasmid-like protein (TIGR03299 family)
MHDVETMAYAGRTPWHGLGEEVSGDLSAKDMLKKAHLNWSVARKPLTAAGNIPVPNHYALVRDSDESVLGLCGKDYIPTQNSEAFEFFEKFVKAGQMTMETAGSLAGGRHVWGLAKLNRGYTLDDGDRMEGYLLLSSPHIWGKSLTAMLTEVRVVCANTIALALGRGGERFRMPHIKAFDAQVQHAAADALGLSSELLRRLEDEARIMSKAKTDAADVAKYVCALFAPTLYAEIAKHDDSKVAILDQLPRNGQRVMELYHKSPGSDLRTANETWWGAFNAVTRFVDHEMGRDRDVSLTSAWFGPRATLKQRARSLAVESAKAVLAS